MKNRRREPAQPCPLCQGKTRVTGARKPAASIIERYYVCMDADCNHHFKTLTSVVGTVVPAKNGNNLDLFEGSDD
ncbi:ogr/Delta-like zinc finger family protein [Ostreibacterium oceani]|uniref:Zinc finger Ogr/Delta-type domain-containing protein n=1 Tax=Ostreibacterium oceani TaxID=2654998 RepID=A0A6N7F267_9GAMM|nr:ogr/Delta-like zinc finger family protein [Ostreibacterium oceani]MPV86888.1 hypothetical protein [Ostreibacterium oceani]